MGDQKTQEGHGASRDLAHAAGVKLELERLLARAEAAEKIDDRFRPGDLVEATQDFCCGGGLLSRGQEAVVAPGPSHTREYFYLVGHGCVPTRFFRPHAAAPAPALLAAMLRAMVLTEASPTRATAERQPSPRDADPLPQSKATKP